MNNIEHKNIIASKTTIAMPILKCDYFVLNAVLYPSSIRLYDIIYNTNKSNIAVFRKHSQRAYYIINSIKSNVVPQFFLYFFSSKINQIINHKYKQLLIYYINCYNNRRFIWKKFLLIFKTIIIIKHVYGML